MSDPASSAFTELSIPECLSLLSRHTVGRLCIVENDFPVAFPVNYRLADNGQGGAAIVIRTRPGGTLDQEEETRVGFEVDGIDNATNSGWSVVVRGRLHHEDAPITPVWLRSWDPRPWVRGRDTWLYLTPLVITGRQLAPTVVEWAFAFRGYL